MVYTETGKLMKKHGLRLVWGEGSASLFEIAAAASESGAGFAVGRAG